MVRNSIKLFCSQKLPESWFTQFWSTGTEGPDPSHTTHADVTTHIPGAFFFVKEENARVLAAEPVKKYNNLKNHYFKQWLFHYCGKRDCGHLKEHDKGCNIIRWSWKSNTGIQSLWAIHMRFLRVINPWVKGSPLSSIPQGLLLPQCTKGFFVRTNKSTSPA